MGMFVFTHVPKIPFATKVAYKTELNEAELEL